MGNIPLDPEQNESPSKIATGAFVRTAEIIEIEDFSNYPGQQHTNSFESGWTPELCLKLIVNDGKREDKKFMITGWFNRDKTSKIIKGWNTYKNAVHRFCMRIGGEFIQIDESDFSIPKDVLQKFVGLKFMFVRYITPETYQDNSGNNRPNYADWNIVFVEGTELQTITDEFSEAANELTTNKNPKYRYAPGMIQEYSGDETGKDSFEYGANVKEEKSEIPDEDVI